MPVERLSPNEARDAYRVQREQYAHVIAELRSSSGDVRMEEKRREGYKKLLGETFPSIVILRDPDPDLIAEFREEVNNAFARCLDIPPRRLSATREVKADNSGRQRVITKVLAIYVGLESPPDTNPVITVREGSVLIYNFGLLGIRMNDELLAREHYVGRTTIVNSRNSGVAALRKNLSGFARKHGALPPK